MPNDSSTAAGAGCLFAIIGATIALSQSTTIAIAAFVLCFILGFILTVMVKNA